MRGFSIVFLAALATFGIVWGVSIIALRLTGVPKDFPPFTALPLLSGVIGGFLGASIVYALIAAFAQHPSRTFFFVAIAALAISFGLPLRLSFTKSHRFAGVTPAAQMTLALLHTIIATTAVTVLTRGTNVPR
ncbi:hypothetical protein [Granulicella arctica]|uniref:Uncharacterized protein n=1 Tax=Granulicella arctica TaxID=940613 RepID=A0A7Y9PIM9_9BACT|nr:hypothetical protein [Granulicella arctica]NYF80615.1 hypothetical protein [Granulicella arctica]